MILEQSMDNDALARLGRIRMVRPDKAAHIENSIINMALSGKLPGRVTEPKLVEILERTSRRDAAAATSAASSSSGGGGNTTGINIQRKKYSLDSDDDEDDDDDDDV
jgi:programmed cell death protein 5